MKPGGKIFVIILTGLFLLSNTGVSLLLHHCLVCDDTQYFLASFSENTIEHHHDENHHHCNSGLTAFTAESMSDDKHSCGLFTADSECCKTELEYLKNEYESLPTNNPEKLILIQLPIPEDIFVTNLCCIECIAEKVFNDYNEPPPKLVSKEFVIFTHQLKYC